MSHPSSLAVVFAIVVIDLLGFGIIMPLLPIYARRLEASDVVIGLLMSSFSAMQFLFAPVWGRLSDRVGRRPVLLAGLAGSAVFYALFGWATGQLDLTWLFVARIGAGISGANIAVAAAYIADVTPPERRTRGMALIGAAFGIGFTFGPLLGCLFVSDEPGQQAELSPMTGYLAAALSAIAFVVAIFALPESLRPGIDPAASHTRRGLLDLSALRAAVARPAVGLPVLAFFLATFAFGHFEGVLARVTVDVFDWSLRDNFLGFAAIGVILALAQGLLVRMVLAPRLTETTMATTGTLLMSVSLAGLGVGVSLADMTLISATVPPLVVGFALLTPSAQAILSRRTPAHLQGSILGLNQSASALARILGPFLGNVFYHWRDDHAMPFLIAATVMALAAVVCLVMSRQGDHDDDPAPQLGDSLQKPDPASDTSALSLLDQTPASPPEIAAHASVASRPRHPPVGANTP